MCEIFRKYNDRIEVSSLGRIKKDGEVIEPIHTNPYDIITIGRRRTERVHVLVATMFPEICGVKRKWYHVHHKNHNQRDNRAENLVWLSRSEHRRLHQLEDGVSRPVKAYRFDGKEVEKVGEWCSKTQASEATGVDYRHITEIILKKNGRFTAGGYWWFLADEPEENILKKILSLQAAKYKRVRK